MQRVSEMFTTSTCTTNHPDSFGFIKYHNFEDAEDCIRGFHYLGYEVSFARVSLPFDQSFYNH
jgi:RNA recognition motif-containing protein